MIHVHDLWIGRAEKVTQVNDSTAIYGFYEKVAATAYSITLVLHSSSIL